MASYNSGPGNVTKAIRRADGQQNFWNIKKYLPKETQGYVPAFLATMYIFEYHKAHGIIPKKAAATNGIGEVQYFTYPNNELNGDLAALDFIENQITESGMQQMQGGNMEEDMEMGNEMIL